MQPQVTLKLIETFVDKCEDLSLVTESLVPAMMDPILGDYARNVPDARYSNCLTPNCLNLTPVHVNSMSSMAAALSVSF